MTTRHCDIVIWTYAENVYYMNCSNIYKVAVFEFLGTREKQVTR